MEKGQTVNIVVSCTREVFSEKKSQNEISRNSIGESTRLIGRDSIVDSLGLVTLIVALEQKLAEDYGITVTIADERAMSQEKSPFRTVGSLADYVFHLIGEQDHND